MNPDIQQWVIQSTTKSGIRGVKFGDFTSIDEMMDIIREYQDYKNVKVHLHRKFN